MKLPQKQSEVRFIRKSADRWQGGFMDLKINAKDRILVLTPHPDDESIGCGGFLLSYASQCDVTLLTDGAKGSREWSETQTRKVRKKEFQTAMKWLGIEKWETWDIPDQGLGKNKYRLGAVNLADYTYVLVPNRNESHPDHRIIFDEIRKNVIRNAIKIKILEYEVWTPMANPTHFLNISDIIQQKKQLIRHYKSALKHIDYDRRITALNYYRGIHYGCKFAECYNQTDYTDE